MPNHPIAKRLDALLTGHDWNRNRFIRKLRKEGGQIRRRKNEDGTWSVKTIAPRRLSIRTEREQTLNALARAMIYRADFDPDAPYLFEVRASVEELARMIGQLHEYAPGYDGDDGQYRHGRKSCDPVHGAIEDMEAADMLVIVRQWDSEQGTYKASRIFFKPNFFRGFGLTMDDTKSMLAHVRKWQEKHNLTETARQKRQAHLLRMSDEPRIANMDRPSLRNLLARLRREFTGENKHTKEVLKAHHAIKNAEKRLNARQEEIPERTKTEHRLMTLQKILSPAQVFRAAEPVEAKLGKQAKGTPAFNEMLLEILETLI
jgi:hypothetical protein